ncbi:MAG: hypothetical protein BWY88_00604 [Synergistetes bacterium ADurb.Bin520]|nr:MAG: hypothetical protein BWY88_00604 [Synergistetes bacterium ADurb.Bin520]
MFTATRTEVSPCCPNTAALDCLASFPVEKTTSDAPTLIRYDCSILDRASRFSS